MTHPTDDQILQMQLQALESYKNSLVDLHSWAAQDVCSSGPPANPRTPQISAQQEHRRIAQLSQSAR